MEQIKILPINDYLDENKQNSITKNQILLSSLAYLDVENVLKILSKDKIILTQDHFFTFIYAFVLNKVAIRLFHSKPFRILNRCYHSKAYNNKLLLKYCDEFYEEKTRCIKTNAEFNLNYLKNDLNNILKVFATNGFKFKKEVKIIFNFLEMDDSSIEHLYNFSDEDQQIINQINKEKFIQYTKHISKTKCSEPKNNITKKNINALVKLCETYQQTDILNFLKTNKKIQLNQECLEGILQNFNIGVFEYFYRLGYKPSLYQINNIFSVEQRFILLIRFYPEQFYSDTNKNDIMLKSMNDYLKKNILDNSNVDISSDESDNEPPKPKKTYTKVTKPKKTPTIKINNKFEYNSDELVIEEIIEEKPKKSKK